ncbi:MAG: chemotaxis protein CheW [Gammaproteobacteria bacterium]|nr:chemotaxis protein CheW [Gammaproteobacteria bacterium]
MVGKRPDSSSLAEPQEALGFYLDSLLMDLPAEVPEAAPLETSTETSVGVSADATSASPAESRPVDDAPTASPLVPVSRQEMAVQQSVMSRPFVEPDRVLPLLVGPSLLPHLLMEHPDVGTVPENTRDRRQAEPSVAPVPSLPAEPIPLAEEAPAAVPDRQPTFQAAPEVSSAASIDEPVVEPRRRAVVKAEAPSWASDSFQCLTFTVAGLTLAAPLERLHGIVEWPGELTGLPGYADWFMGLLPNRGQNVRIIDTAQIIMPDGRIADARPVLERVKYVVLIDAGRWGLAVDAIAQVLTLSPDGVRWRGERGKRPWLAGTAVEQMCAVLDIDNLSAQLAEGLKLEDG